jgi:hypothetical protein
MNEQLHTNIDQLKADPPDYENFKRLAKYSPLIGSYDNLYDSAITLPSNNDSDYNIFYKNLIIFSLDLGAIQYQLSYHVAYSSTRELASSLGLDEIRPYIGNEAYSAVLSGIHWTIRENFNNQTQTLFNFIGEKITNISI